MDGRETRAGAVVRADSVRPLTGAGWSALEAHGIRTIVDLRNDHELEPDAAPRPSGLETLHLPLDGVEDTEFWAYWEDQALPLFYRPHLERFPERHVAVIAAIAHAPPGGVVFHCVGGRDRTGLVAMVVLALAGVAPEEIAADHALSGERLAPYYARAGAEDQTAVSDELLRRDGTSAREVIVSGLASLDVEAHLRGHGLGDDDLASLRRRLTRRSSRGTRGAALRARRGRSTPR